MRCLCLFVSMCSLVFAEGQSGLEGKESTIPVLRFTRLF